jgi:hypothetical protein
MTIFWVSTMFHKTSCQSFEIQWNLLWHKAFPCNLFPPMFVSIALIINEKMLNTFQTAESPWRELAPEPAPELAEIRRNVKLTFGCNARLLWKCIHFKALIALFRSRNLNSKVLGYQSVFTLMWQNCNYWVWWINFLTFKYRTWKCLKWFLSD